MRAYIVRRSVYAFVTFLMSLVLIFIIPRLVAVNPVDIIAASQMLPPSVTERLIVQFGLNKPVYVQFILFMKNMMLTFPPNMGYSFEYYPTSTYQLISTALPWTLFLIGTSVIISSTIGTFVGLYAGYKRGSVFDKAITYSSMAFMSLPYFWVAIVFQILLAVVLRIFPVAGGYSVLDASPKFSLTWISDVIYHAMLPMLTIVISTAPVYAIIMRNNVVNIVMEDFMNVAQAKGLRKGRILVSYALRNSILPLISIIAVNFGYVLGGALLVEIVFNYPGIGTVLYNAILGHDYPVIQGVFYILAIAVILANYVADLLYMIVDPRIRYT